MACRAILGDMQRRLGETSVGAVGAGCWAIGGPWRFDGRPAGWGRVDDDESRSFDQQDAFLRDMLAALAPGFRRRLLGQDGDAA